MISKQDNPIDFIKELQAIANSLQSAQSPQWFKKMRLAGISKFSELGIPTVKDEEWKYTNLASLAKLTFERPTNSDLIEMEAFRAYRNDEDINIVFVNGSLSAELSNINKIPKGITISTIDEAIANSIPDIEKFLTQYDLAHETAFVGLNEALNETGTYIGIEKKTVYEGLIHIIHVTSSKSTNTVSMPRTLITLDQSSEVTILESHIAFNDQIVYFTNALTDIFLGEDATLHYSKAQKESLNAFHIGQTRVFQERNSNYDGFTLTVGSKLTRNNLNIVLNGEGADTILNALYSIYGQQHVDNHTSVDHRVPNCTSNQLYKGILNNASRAVFNGKVFVRPIAQQTNSYQLNKNLLLGNDCRIDTKPQLEIFADDVKCTHGATIGQLDENEMFYLQTRCIPRNLATKMLVHGFVDDLFSTIKNNTIRQKVDALMQPSFEVLL